jgi:hypothetical protein
MIVLRIVLIVLIVFLVPLAARALWWWTRDDVANSWGSANWSSAKLLPAAQEARQALIRIYAARTGRWRGIVAHHSWIVVKEAGAGRYTRYDKVGWGSPVRINGWAPDGHWFSYAPETVVALDGVDAERLIPRIREAVESYPYRMSGGYRAWPGPNSNTFVAHVMAQVPELQATLPPTALGKDWLPPGEFVAPTPSRTGLRVSLAGYAGVTLGWIEGVEVNFLGLVAGLDLRRPAIKLPGWGRIGVEPIPQTDADPSRTRKAEPSTAVTGRRDGSL